MGTVNAKMVKCRGFSVLKLWSGMLNPAMPRSAVLIDPGFFLSTGGIVQDKFIRTTSSVINVEDGCLPACVFAVGYMF